MSLKNCGSTIDKKGDEGFISAMSSMHFVCTNNSVCASLKISPIEGNDERCP
jgi:hypothetical protein